MSGYWLMKSEPDAYSIDDLERDGSEHWDGIRNYQARNFMRDQMAVGDRVLFYHSSCKEPGVVGLARVASGPYADFTAWNPESKYYDPKSSEENPRWIMVDIAFVEKLARPVTLKQLRETASLADMRLLQKGNRLSILPVTAQEYRIICDLAGVSGD